MLPVEISDPSLRFPVYPGVFPPFSVDQAAPAADAVKALRGVVVEQIGGAERNQSMEFDLI